MKKFILGSMFSAAILLFSGCTSVSGGTARSVFDTEVEAISDARMQELITLARNALKKNSVKAGISRNELRQITTAEPVIRTEYRGNCFGTMTIVWYTPKKQLGLRFEGDFNAKIPNCFMIIGTENDNNGRIMPDKQRRQY